ncbi:uncharacterized protein [Gossypium hirsutum]|uniref:DNA/RNA polymerases superfamily protein n=1 Tax=Gossypium hirsutum TaxID=3635 RepID=A0A1U8MWJ9_GOSHI|nr:uncharacterized protein LOC107942057 [Gossypium hirsutum]
MLRSCAIDFGGNWDQHFSLAEFVYNNSYQRSIQMSPFKALYGRKCRTPLCWSDMEEKRNLGLDLVHEIEDMVKLICERLKAASNMQKSYADLRCQDIEYLSYLSHVVLVEEIEFRSDLLYEEEPVAILDREIKVLCNKTIPLVKVLWRNQKTEETTWELEDIMRHQYPYLFDLVSNAYFVSIKASHRDEDDANRI